MLHQLLGAFDFRLRRYRRIRDIGTPLMTRISQGLPTGLVLRAGGDLGLIEDGRTFVIESPDILDFVMDRAIHDIVWEGKRWIERVCDEEIKTCSPEEQALLKAHREPAFSLYEVTEVRPGHGARLKDLFGGRELFLTDLGFGATGCKGLVLATRVISHRGVYFTAGVTMAYSTEQASPFVERLSALYREQAGAPAWNETMRSQAPALFREYRKGDIEVEFASITRAPAGPLRTETGEAAEAPASPEEGPPRPGREAHVCRRTR